MDDITEKLSLLDYENAFCKGWKQKKISRIYFAHERTGEDQLLRANYFYDIVYWLMSLNKDKDKAKKMGPFVPFKDFKGNVSEAMQKLVNDLKKFGYQGWRNLKIDQLKNGYGDQACDIITELINLELYRRDFKFLPPVFPPDEENDSGEEETQSHDFDTSSEAVFMIHGGRIIEASTLD